MQEHSSCSHEGWIEWSRRGTVGPHPIAGVSRILLQTEPDVVASVVDQVLREVLDEEKTHTHLHSTSTRMNENFQLLGHRVMPIGTCILTYLKRSRTFMCMYEYVHEHTYLLSYAVLCHQFTVKVLADRL